jgi:hypothetical protein
VRKAIVGAVAGLALFAGGMAYAGGPTSASVSSLSGTVSESGMTYTDGAYEYTVSCPTGTYVLTAVETSTTDPNSYFEITTGQTPGLPTSALVYNLTGADAYSVSYEIVCITIPT